MKTKNDVGRCHLCLQDGLVLQDSHYLPAGLYRRIYGDNSENPNPVSITSTSVVQTSIQLKAHLLCSACEGRLNKGGESWLLQQCRQRDGSFPLLSTLSKYVPALSDPSSTTSRLYFARDVPEINVDALTYFAISMIWRGTLYPWNSDQSYPVSLGPYAESFRKYLMGTSPAPPSVRLSVTLREDSPLSKLMYGPTGGRLKDEQVHAYRFPIPGFAFLMTVGKNPPEEMGGFCIITSPTHPVVVSSILEPLIESEMTELYGKAVDSGAKIPFVKPRV